MLSGDEIPPVALDFGTGLSDYVMESVVCAILRQTSHLEGDQNQTYALLSPQQTSKLLRLAEMPLSDARVGEAQRRISLKLLGRKGVILTVKLFNHWIPVRLEYQTRTIQFWDPYLAYAQSSKTANDDSEKTKITDEISHVS